MGFGKFAGGVAKAVRIVGSIASIFTAATPVGALMKASLVAASFTKLKNSHFAMILLNFGANPQMTLVRAITQTLGVGTPGIITPGAALGFILGGQGWQLKGFLQVLESAASKASRLMVIIGQNELAEVLRNMSTVAGTPGAPVQFGNCLDGAMIEMAERSAEELKQILEEFNLAAGPTFTPGFHKTGRETPTARNFRTDENFGNGGPGGDGGGGCRRVGITTQKFRGITCTEILAVVKEIRFSELEKRFRELREDPLKLPLMGKKGSVQSHIKELEVQQARLRLMLLELEARADMGCCRDRRDGVPEDAWKYASRVAPRKEEVEANKDYVEIAKYLGLTVLTVATVLAATAAPPTAVLLTILRGAAVGAAATAAA
mmetsp:Transcript_25006/g.58056  ORF Transcript_25006/g.58056 Transcript_25006/m.58056 type:complete len:376 (+) Transcript_25006:3-1130(+)